MTAHEKAQSGVKMLQEALLEYLDTQQNGVPAKEMREDLGLNTDADPKGKHRGMLMWGVINLLMQEGKVEMSRDNSPYRIRLLR